MNCWEKTGFYAPLMEPTPEQKLKSVKDLCNRLNIQVNKNDTYETMKTGNLLMSSPRPWSVTGSSTTVRVIDKNGKTVCTMKPCESDIGNAEMIVESVNNQ